MDDSRQLSQRQKAILGVAAILELCLKGYAAWDLAHRDSSGVRGPKFVWGPALLVNFFGPLAYLCFGRR